MVTESEPDDISISNEVYVLCIYFKCLFPMGFLTTDSIIHKMMWYTSDQYQVTKFTQTNSCDRTNKFLNK